MKKLVKNTSSKANAIKAILIVFAFVFSANGYSQNSIKISSDTIINPSIEVVTNHSIALDSDMDFVSWFMGNKQFSTENKNSDSSSIESSKNTKKQLLSSGVTVNRILYKVLLKKMVNQEISIA